MDKDTRYRYEKRINELGKEVVRNGDLAFDYRRIAMEIFDAAVNAASDGSAVKASWIISKFKQVMR